MLTFFTILIALVSYVLFRMLLIVSERETAIIERLGKYHQTLTPGFYFLIPFIDRVAYIHEMREQVLDIPPQSVITSDNIQVSVDGFLYIKVLDPTRASYGIADYISASVNLAQTTMRSEIGKLTLGETFSERERVNAKIISEIDKASDPWGVKVLRYEIRDIVPSGHVIDTLEKLMEAEREKRASITMATAEKEKLINVSEGQKRHAINLSEGEKMKRINEAQGKAESIKIVAEATSKGIEVVANAISSTGGQDAVKMRIMEQYIEQLGEVIENNDVAIFPAQIASMKGIFDEVIKPALKNN